MDKPANIQKHYSTPERTRVAVFDDLLERVDLTKPWVAVALGSALYLIYLVFHFVAKTPPFTAGDRATLRSSPVESSCIIPPKMV